MSLYNALFGQNKAAELLMAMIGLTKEDAGRFRDCYLMRVADTKDAGGLRIVVYTRTGGGNREDYAESNDAMAANKNYVEDHDAEHDSTYAEFVFTVPEKFHPAVMRLEEMGAAEVSSPAEKFEAMMNGLKAGNKDDPTVQRALAVGEKIFAAINQETT